MRTDILVVGGGTGGIAAALVASSLSQRVVMTEETDSVGTGFYGIDVHYHAGGAPNLSLQVFPVQIPLGAMIPVRLRNLLPAAKNLGVTHLTNGCYRLHPVEWNIGEAAGALAAYCRIRGVEPSKAQEPARLAEFQALLRKEGFCLEWPEQCDLSQHAKFLRDMHAAGQPSDRPRYFC